MILECFVMVGMNIGNFVTDMAFIADVRKEYDSLRQKMGIPHSRDVPEEGIEEEDDDEDEDGALPASAGGDAAVAAAAVDIAAE